MVGARSLFTQLTVSSTKVAANGSITVSATVSAGQFFVYGIGIGGLAPVTNGTSNMARAMGIDPRPKLGSGALNSQHKPTFPPAEKQVAKESREAIHGG